MKMLKMKKLLKLQRSAQAPVTMVAVVSMNTIMNRNSTIGAGVVAVAGQEEAGGAEEAPAVVAVDRRADGEHVSCSVGRPPSVTGPPMAVPLRPPHMNAKPQTKKPNMPSA